MKYKHSLTEHNPNAGRESLLAMRPELTKIYCRGGRTGTKVHTATSGSSVLDCGKWLKALVGHWRVTTAQADRMTRCEKCFTGKWQETEIKETP